MISISLACHICYSLSPHFSFSFVFFIFLLLKNEMGDCMDATQWAHLHMYMNAKQYILVLFAPEFIALGNKYAPVCTGPPHIKLGHSSSSWQRVWGSAWQLRVAPLPASPTLRNPHAPASLINVNTWAAAEQKTPQQYSNMLCHATGAGSREDWGGSFSHSYITRDFFPSST